MHVEIYIKNYKVSYLYPIFLFYDCKVYNTVVLSTYVWIPFRELKSCHCTFGILISHCKRVRPFICTNLKFNLPQMYLS